MARKSSVLSLALIITLCQSQLTAPPCNVGYVNCIVSPCSRETCPAVPNAVCTNNFCGGCYAKFTDPTTGNELTHTMCQIDPTKTTTTTLPPPVLITTTTAAPPEIVLTVPPVQPPQQLPYPSPFCSHGWVHCSPAPCDTTHCPYYPNAHCINNYCGECSAHFYDSYNNQLTYAQCGLTTVRTLPPQPVTTTTRAPIYTQPPVPVITTTRAPIYTQPPVPVITTTQAPAVTLPPPVITTQAPVTTNPPNIGMVCSLGWEYCPVPPCSTNTCPLFPNAICVDNYCGGCFADFYYDELNRIYNNKITDMQCGISIVTTLPPPPITTTTPAPIYTPPPPVTTSQPYIPPCFDGYVNCLVPPCDMNSCPMFPNARCVDDYCGGCNVLYFDGNDQRISLEQCVMAQATTTAPVNTPVPVTPVEPEPVRVKYTPQGPFCSAGWVYCSPSPCEILKCEGYPTASCANNYCGQCNAIYYDELDYILTYEQCNPPPPTDRPTANPTVKAPTNRPTNMPITSTDRPTANPTTQSPTERPTTTTSTTTTQAPVPNPCVVGYAYCEVSPCHASSCPLHPNAICVDNYCGGCFADFYYDSTNLVNGKALSEVQCGHSIPVIIPTQKPTNFPTERPTDFPTKKPTNMPITPTNIPTTMPLTTPTKKPTNKPTNMPITPTDGPTTKAPTKRPTTTTSTTTQAPVANPCVLGFAYCEVSPCHANSCPLHPNAICVDNYCGGCFADFYYDATNLVNGKALTEVQCGHPIHTNIPTDNPVIAPTKRPITPTNIPTDNPVITPTNKPTNNPITPTNIPIQTVSTFQPQIETVAPIPVPIDPIIDPIPVPTDPVCTKDITEMCTLSDVCCGLGLSGVAQCLEGQCCIKHRRKGCLVTSDCCRSDAVCSNGKCKLDRTITPAAAGRSDNKLDNVEFLQDNDGHEYVSISMTRLVIIILLIVVVVIPIAYYCYYRNVILKRIKKAVRRRIHHGLSVSVHSDDEFADSDTSNEQYVD